MSTTSTCCPKGSHFRVNRSFDEQVGYRTKSMLVMPMTTPQGEVIGVLQLINRKRDPAACLPDAAAEVLAHVDPLPATLARRARVAGRRRAREQPALRRHPAAVRGLRAGVGHRDRVARSDDVGPLRARRRPHRGAGRSGRSRDERTVRGVALHARRDARDPVRGAAARLRQGRRARAGAGEGEEALSAPARADPAALRRSCARALELERAAAAARLPARARARAAIGERSESATTSWPRARRARRGIEAVIARQRADRAGRRTASSASTEIAPLSLRDRLGDARDRCSTPEEARSPA